MSQPPAGWYPDPQHDNSERWWDGTGWTANARSLNHVPAAVPQPPVPAAGPLPGAGWYLSPHDDTEEMWFDGASWTQLTQVRQGARDPGGYYPGHRQGPNAAPGGGSLVDGLVGRPTPRGSRRGDIGSFFGILLGLVFVVGGFFMSSAIKTPANMSATMTGTVTDVTVSERFTMSKTGRQSHPVCSPVAGFMVGGKAYTASTSVEDSPCPWTVGQPIVVAYDPTSPALATIPREGAIQYAPWMISGIGGLLAVGILVRSVRMERRRKAATSPA